MLGLNDLYLDPARGMFEQKDAAFERNPLQRDRLDLAKPEPEPIPARSRTKPSVPPPISRSGWFGEHMDLDLNDGISYRTNFQFQETNARLKIYGPIVKGHAGVGARLRGLQLGEHPVEMRARAEVVGVFRQIAQYARGKFIFIGDDKFFVRGVTYGAFRPNRDGREYHDAAIIESDFAQMAACGINAVRIPHTMPPRSLLDVARQHGLRVMVGLSAEQYLGLLIDGKKSLADIESLVRAKVRECAGHPALLSYALGNEIAAPMARWLGRARIERYLGRLTQAVKTEDPGGLVTYVNYPTTEYLELPFLDLVCFNVYLESQARFEAYLGRLQNIAGERPLVMSELGLDGLRGRLRVLVDRRVVPAGPRR